MARARPWCVPCVASAEKQVLTRRLRGARSHPLAARSGIQILGTGSPAACLCFSACLRSVKGGLAEIRWLRRPSVCRRSWQEAEHKLCLSAWEVLQVTKSCGAGNDFACERVWDRSRNRRGGRLACASDRRSSCACRFFWSVGHVRG